MQGIVRLEGIIQELANIRVQLRQVAYKITIEAEAEQKLLMSKGKIARNLQPLIAELGNPQNLRFNIIKLLRQTVSLRQLSRLPELELRALEKDLHRHQIHLHLWLGELRV